MDEAGCRIVTRFKSHTPLTVMHERSLRGDTGHDSRILSDRIGLLPARQARNRKNPLSKSVREITVRTETGKVLRILSNDLNATAHEIADLYKRRWAIELAENQASAGEIGKCRPHPDHCGPHCVHHSAYGAGRPEDDPKPASLRAPRAYQPHAQTQNRPPP